MSGLNIELDDGILSPGEELGPLHPDFPRDTTTDRFLRTWHRAVSELDSEINKLDDLVKAFEEDGSDARMMDARNCQARVKNFLKNVVELKLEAGGNVV